MFTDERTKFRSTLVDFRNFLAPYYEAEKSRGVKYSTLEGLLQAYGYISDDYDVYPARYRTNYIARGSQLLNEQNVYNVNSDDFYFVIESRTGGGNREEYAEENDAMACDSRFVCDVDDSFDSTYALFVYELDADKNRELKDAYEMLTSNPLRDVLPRRIESVSELYDLVSSALDVSGKTDNDIVFFDQVRLFAQFIDGDSEARNLPSAWSFDAAQLAQRLPGYLRSGSFSWAHMPTSDNVRRDQERLNESLPHTIHALALSSPDELNIDQPLAAIRLVKEELLDYRLGEIQTLLDDLKHKPALSNVKMGAELLRAMNGNLGSMRDVTEGLVASLNDAKSVLESAREQWPTVRSLPTESKNLLLDRWDSKLEQEKENIQGLFSKSVRDFDNLMAVMYEGREKATQHLELAQGNMKHNLDMVERSVYSLKNSIRRANTVK